MDHPAPTPKRSPWLPVSFLLSLAALAYAFYLAMTAPVEATMGNLYRVFFYHVPHAQLSFLFPYINMVASLLFLYWQTRPGSRSQERARKADALALASAELTVLYSTAGLASGMIWGRAAWGIWWAWDARLTTYLLLWLLYVSYLLLRRMATPATGPASGASATTAAGVLPAVLAIFAAIDIPICFMSIRWWRTQHPSPVFGGDMDSGLDKSMYPAFLWGIAAWALWGFTLLAARYVLERRRQAAAERAAFALLGRASGHADPAPGASSGTAAGAQPGKPRGFAGHGGLA